MFSKDTLKQAIVTQRKAFLTLENPIDRDILDETNFNKNLKTKIPMIITGVRRCGKSYLMKLIWQKHKISEKLPEYNFLYFNFDLDMLYDFQVADFQLLLDTYFELYEVDKNKRIFLFFDEIQVIKHWEKFISRLYDDKRFKVIITGSNATLLSKEISSSLTGRNTKLNLSPLSFREFFNYSSKIKLTDLDFYDTNQRVEIRKILNQYLLLGGFPEIILNKNRNLLQEYFKDILYRDIIGRFKIREIDTLKKIAAFLSANIGMPTSLEKIKNITKTKSINTIKNYLSYICDSFLFAQVSKFSYSLKDQIYNPDKYYICDIGMYLETAFMNSENRGHILENLIFNELTRRNLEAYYFKEKNECDFVIKEKTKITQVIQVTKVLNDNKFREIEGLLDASDKFQLKQGLILCEDNEEEEIKIKNKTIQIKPIYRWLLEK